VNVVFEDGFWAPRVRLMAEEVIPHQWKALNDQIPGAEPSHAVENFRIAAGEVQGTFHGMVFQDSDVAKWLEAASYSLQYAPNPELERLVDEVVDLLGRAQREDGYLNTYFTVAAPDGRWKDMSFGHELYCAGHLIEAAVAHHEATGKTNFLSIVRKYADLIRREIGPDPGQRRIYDGHEEIELALVKLYQATGDESYLQLAKYFIDERGRQPCFLLDEPTFGGEAKDRWFHLDYFQAHAPVREQRTAEGHAVRAMYLYSAMADLARLTGDAGLKETLLRLWDNVTQKRMYITGGIGSQGHGERFTIDYDLPNDTAYAETCAAIGLVFWASRMFRLDPDAKYADVMERALYNGVLSGISLDGKRYFYVNPLEVHPPTAHFRHDMQHVKTERVPWFGCACCPPNIARLVASLNRYVCTAENGDVFYHLYAGSRSEWDVNGRTVRLAMKTDYPWDGRIDVAVECGEPVFFHLCFRWPGWADEAAVAVNGERVDARGALHKGYIRLGREWRNGDRIRLHFPMRVKRMAAHPLVRENAGKVAVQRGPVVYCLEEVDNGPHLADIRLAANPQFETEFRHDLMGGIVVIRADGYRSDPEEWGDVLYRELSGRLRKMTITFVPYACWGNRKKGEMTVWVRQLERG